MDDESKKLLGELLEVSRDNNQMLRSLARAQKWARVYRVAYWSVIIIASIGGYYFIEPYLSGLVNLYSGGASSLNNLKDIKASLDSSKIQQLIRDLNIQ